MIRIQLPVALLQGLFSFHFYENEESILAAPMDLGQGIPCVRIICAEEIDTYSLVIHT